jgi:hypothetical protein
MRNDLVAQMGYLTLEELEQRYNGIVKLKISDRQTIHCMIDRLIYEKRPFIMQNYNDNTFEINFSK